MTRFFVSMVLALAAASPFSAQAQTVSYKRQIAPIFASNCNGCHNAKTPQSKLTTENFHGLSTGGRRGKCLVPGKSVDSLLIQFVDGRKTPRMPVGGSLKPAEIALLAKWIDEGAKSDGEPTAGGSKALFVKPKEGMLAPISSLCWSGDGKRLFVGDYQEVRVVNPMDGTTIQALTGCADAVRSVAISPNGQMLAAAGGLPGQSGQVVIWNVADLKPIKTLEGHTDNILGMAFSADNLRIATTSYDKTVRIWDIASAKSTVELKDHADAVFGATYAAKGKYLVTVSADRSVRVWDGITAKRLYSLAGTQEPIMSVSANPTADIIATGGAERVVRLWNLRAETGDNFRTFSGVPDTITDVSYSPDGKWIAGTCGNGQCFIWDASNGGLKQTISASKQPLLSVRFAPNSETVAIGGNDGSLTIWNSATGVRLFPAPEVKQPIK
ncbi:MAG: hypothetical protein ABJA67_11970 [Chthonomonadales bacterium]